MPFTIQVGPADLDDLAARLSTARFAPRVGQERWRGGADPGYLRQLVTYWAEEFSWQRQADYLNSYRQAIIDVEGTPIHVVRIAARNRADAEPIPILLLHGWPSCFVEMLPLADRLADPARFGLAAGRSFDVVIPSLPGFLYSGLPEAVLTRAEIGRLMHQLMTKELGHTGYMVFGGDIGGGAAAQMGALYPDYVIGLHLIHPPYRDEAGLGAVEREYLESVARYDQSDGGYSEIMLTRPDTIAAALIDSPVGLAAWIIDKFHDWVDHDGNLEARVSRDALLTIVTLYWITGSIGTSFKTYFDYEHNAPQPVIDVPVAVTLSREPSRIGFPRQLAERVCSDIRFWRIADAGGHFMALEQPDMIWRDILSSTEQMIRNRLKHQ
jgi:pimeloyl-ACP methyl ester carboxylesterase